MALKEHRMPQMVKIMVFLKLTQKILLYVTIVLLIIACSSRYKKSIPTQTHAVDCKTRWEWEQVAESKDLAFYLELDKAQYGPKEPIYTTLVLKNLDSIPLWVNKRMLVDEAYNDITAEVYFAIVSPWGEFAENIVKTDALEPELNDFVLLGPAETFEVASDGMMYYTYMSFWESEHKRDDVSGKYCVWAVYHNETNPGLDGIVWEGKIKSNFVEYTITR